MALPFEYGQSRFFLQQETQKKVLTTNKKTQKIVLATNKETQKKMLIKGQETQKIVLTLIIYIES